MTTAEICIEKLMIILSNMKNVLKETGIGGQLLEICKHFFWILLISQYLVAVMIE